MTNSRTEELRRQREEAIAAADRAVGNGNVAEELWWRGWADKLSLELDDERGAR